MFAVREPILGLLFSTAIPAWGQMVIRPRSAYIPSASTSLASSSTAEACDLVLVSDSVMRSSTTGSSGVTAVAPWVVECTPVSVDSSSQQSSLSSQPAPQSRTDPSSQAAPSSHSASSPRSAQSSQTGPSSLLYPSTSDVDSSSSSYHPGSVTGNPDPSQSSTTSGTSSGPSQSTSTTGLASDSFSDRSPLGSTSNYATGTSYRFSQSHYTSGFASGNSSIPSQSSSRSDSSSNPSPLISASGSASGSFFKPSQSGSGTASFSTPAQPASISGSASGSSFNPSQTGSVTGSSPVIAQTGLAQPGSSTRPASITTSSEITLGAPTTTTLPATAFISAAPSASSQLVGLLPIISKWIDNPSGSKDNVLYNIGNVRNQIEGLLSESGGSLSGGCSSSKKKIRLRRRDPVGDIVNDIASGLECAVEGLAKISGSINADDGPEVQRLVDDLGDIADNIGEAEDDNNDNQSSDSQSPDEPSSYSSSSTTETSSSSGSCSASVAAHVTSDCFISTITTDGMTTVGTTCTSSTTVETTGCSVTATTARVFSSSSGSTPAQCATSNCGNACNLNPGPTMGSMSAASTPDSCAFVSTVTTDSLPTARQGLYGTLTIDNPSPSAVPGGSLSKRAHLVMPEDEIDNDPSANILIRTLADPPDPQQYVSGLRPAWVNQHSSVSGTYYAFDVVIHSAAGVNGIYGCTGVFVVSEKGVFISHIWEDPVFSDDKWQVSSDDYFYANSIQALLDGTATSASLTALQGTDDHPGPLNVLYSPKVFVATPFTLPWIREHLGITTNLHYHDRAIQIAQTLSTRLSGSASNGFVFGYTRTGELSSTGPGWIGRAILEVDPFERWITSPNAPNDAGLQIGKWRLWVQDVAVAEQEFWVAKTDVIEGASSKRSVGVPNPCAGSGPTSSGSASASPSFSAATSSNIGQASRGASSVPAISSSTDSLSSTLTSTTFSSEPFSLPNLPTLTSGSATISTPAGSSCAGTRTASSCQVLGNRGTACIDVPVCTSFVATTSSSTLTEESSSAPTGQLYIDIYTDSDCTDLYEKTILNAIGASYQPTNENGDPVTFSCFSVTYISKAAADSATLTAATDPSCFVADDTDKDEFRKYLSLPDIQYEDEAPFEIGCLSLVARPDN